MIIIEKSLGFVLFVGQKEQIQEVTVGSEKSGFFTIFDTLYTKLLIYCDSNGWID